MKKLLTILASLFMVSIVLTACGIQSNSNSEKATNKATSSNKATKSIPTDANHEWFYRDNVFYAGNETMTLTKSEVRDGFDGTKVLVIYNTIKNNSDKEQDPSNFYMVLHAKQKNANSNVNLTPGIIESDDNGNTPLQTESDNLNNSLLPGKTVDTVLIFKLENMNKVTLEFSNADSHVIGTRTYDVQ